MKHLLAVLLGFFGMIVFFYVLWLAFVPMAIGQRWVDRKVVENSQQYVETQRSALVQLYAGYTGTSETARQAALRGQICEIAANLQINDIPEYIRPLTRTCK